MKLVIDFIADCKRRGFVPTKQSTISEDDFVAFCNEELEQTIWPEITILNEDFNVISSFIAIKTDAGSPNFPNNVVPIPYRAYVRAVRDVFVVSKPDFVNNDEVKKSVTLIDPNNEEHYQSKSQGSSYSYSSQEMMSSVFMYPLNDGIKFVGSFRDVDEMIELRYVSAPPLTVSSTSLHADITRLQYDNNFSQLTITVPSVGTDLNTFCPDEGVKLFDVYRKSSGALVFSDILFTRAASTFITVQLGAADVVTLASFQEGGFNGTENSLSTGYDADLMLVPAKKTNYIPLPSAWINLLQAAVVMRVFSALGDQDAYDREQREYNRRLKKLAFITNKRIIGEQKVINPFDGLRHALIGGSGRSYGCK